MKVKASDYIARFCAGLGAKHVFGVTGGAAAHLFDSAANSGQLQPIFTHHEQAAAFAAVAQARVTNAPGVLFCTTGPGGTNAITGVVAAWLDSVPLFVVSGQTRVSHTSHGKTMRQFGVQEFDIVGLASRFTKYAVMVQSPDELRRELERAAWEMSTGRPGPVWIDVPQDIQWSQVDIEAMEGFTPPLPRAPAVDDALVDRCAAMIETAERPLVLAGAGIRAAGGGAALHRLLTRWSLPVVTTWNASDLVADDFPGYCGRPGLFGQRGANLAVQNCDLLLAVGSHLCVAVTGTMFTAFARSAQRIVVDIDPVELANSPVRIDLPVPMDARAFLDAMAARTPLRPAASLEPWRQRIAMYHGRYNRVPEEWGKAPGSVNPYAFIDLLCTALGPRDIVVVDGGGTVNQITFQAFRSRAEQRLMITGGICSMGSGLPEAVGACVASGRRTTICLTGDGSMQFNVQELQTIRHHDLPVKIFVLDNAGYLSIRNTQNQFLGGRRLGSETEGGLSLPDFVRVAEAYDIPAIRLSGHAGLADRLRDIIASPDPQLVVIDVSPDFEIQPRQGFDELGDGRFAPRPLEDMWPYLDRKEFAAAMVVEPWTGG
jgi:acetolactate synthase-1/2/3 large subunit